jgi:hypothetical protein
MSYRWENAPPVRTLVPFADEERISIPNAARIAGKSERTLRNWCVEHGIGRRVAGGNWAVSKVALMMLRGERGSSEIVAGYYRPYQVAHLSRRSSTRSISGAMYSFGIATLTVGVAPDPV